MLELLLLCLLHVVVVVVVVVVVIVGVVVGVVVVIVVADVASPLENDCHDNLILVLHLPCMFHQPSGCNCHLKLGAAILIYWLT